MILSLFICSSALSASVTPRPRIRVHLLDSLGTGVTPGTKAIWSYLVDTRIKVGWASWLIHSLCATRSCPGNHIQHGLGSGEGGARSLLRPVATDLYLLSYCAEHNAYGIPTYRNLRIWP